MRSELVLTLAILAPVLGAAPSAQSVSEQTPKQQASRLLNPVIESIEVVDVSTAVRKTVLARIGVRVGDTLTADAKQRIGLQIGRVQKGMTFTYTPGFKPGTVKLRIDPSC
jgi:hypothetical protein